MNLVSLCKQTERHYLKPHSMNTTKTTWEEGANAYHKGLALADNPYLIGTVNYRSWEAAFIDAKETAKRTKCKL